MPRSQNKVASHRRRKKVLKAAKGFWGGRSKLITIAKHHVDKGLQYAYRDRKTKKRLFRELWITRINAAVRENGMTYSEFIFELKKKGIVINRKTLAVLAAEQPKAFNAIIEFLK
ncbi:MAG: 50S ribosomal protein L20 [Ignavibacteria bacterium]|nr:50S ribosomal protein L20 [Bacteroidota bacterium]MSQ45465.1 50S ribosomal protein L20 [Ignavibacteria bacterium]